MPIVTTLQWGGRRVFVLVDAIGHFTGFFAQTITACLRPPWRVRLILDQSWSMGLRAMPVAMVTAVFVGMVIVLQGGYQLQAFNAKQYVAGGAGRALTQVMVPIFTALVVGARTAASMAAELGTMRVTEQIDAMEVLDVKPRDYLISPRVIASTLMLPVIVLYADVLGLLGGLFMGVFGLNLTARYYLSITFKFLLYSDIIMGLIKSVFYGLTIGVCGCYFGFNATGGAEGVGRATTRAVVSTLILIILLEYLLSSWTIQIMDTLMQKPIHSG